MKKLGIILFTVLLTILSGVFVEASDNEKKVQTICPVMGGKVSAKVYHDYNGMRIYACCSGCISTIKADPQKHIDKIKSQGETPAIISNLCKHCGDIKGSPACCAPNVAKCPKCGLHKGAPGCCPGVQAKVSSGCGCGGCYAH